jgi:hypothetical protein
LIYPLIFWNGTGGCGVEAGQPFQKATTLMRKSLIALVMQPRGYFLHEMGTLREEFICALSGRLVNLNIKYLAEMEKDLFQEDKIRADGEDAEKEFGIRTFIPPSLTDSDEYWHHVATRCFGISTQLGPPHSFSLLL